jgi:hypothetical protein
VPTTTAGAVRAERSAAVTTKAGEKPVKVVRAITEARIEHVAGLMRALTYRTGVTSRELAKEWDLGLDRVEELTAAASKRVRAEITDPDRTVAKVCTAFDRVLDDALADGDRRSVLAAGKVWAEVSGASAPAKLHVTGDLAALSDEQLEARKREIRERMTDEMTDQEWEMACQRRKQGRGR